MFRTSVLVAVASLSAFCGSLFASGEKWYENPREHLTIKIDTVSRVFRDSLAVDGIKSFCDIEVSVTRPSIVDGPSQMLVDSLNSFIGEFVVTNCELEVGATIEDRINAELDSLVDYWIKCGGGPRTPWFVSWEIHVSFLDKGVLSLQVTRDRFTNANGTPLRSFNVHFGLPDLRQLTRDSFFVAGYEAYLDSIGERAFRSGVRLTEDADLASAGYTEFGNGQFSLNSNFEILDSGLQFMFNAYEIASGAYGWSFVHLPWDQLRPIIRPGGPLEWVLREE